MKFVKLKIFIILGIILFISSSNKHKLSLNNRSSEIKKISKVNIEVYSDESLKKKKTDFTDVSFSILNEKDREIGIIFNLDNLYEKPNLDKFKNYFTSIGVKMPKESSSIIPFTNIPNCKMNVVKMSWYKPDRISIPIVNEKGENTYLQLIFPITELTEKKKILKKLKDPCEKEILNLRVKLDDFYEKIKNYWEKKTKLKKLEKKIESEKENLNKNSEKNDELNKKKEGYQNQINAILEKQNKTNNETQKLEKDLTDKYHQISDNKAGLAKILSNQTDMYKLLNETNNLTTISEKLLESMKNESDISRANRTKLTSKLMDATTNTSQIEKQKTNLTEKLNILTKDSLNLEKNISINQEKISNLNKIITENKDYLDKLNLTNLLDTINKTIDEIEKDKKEMNTAYNKTDNHTSDVEKGLDKNKSLHQTKNETLNDPKVVENVKKEEELFAQKEIKNAIDLMKKNFPQISEIFINNIFEFCQSKYNEAFNYIYAIRPSNYSLYSNVYLSQKKAFKKILRKSLFYKRRLARRRMMK